MLKKRLIPILLLQNGLLVRSEKFTIHQIIGNPIHEVRRFNEWNVDELIYLDISRDNTYDLRREDSKIKGLEEPWSILDEVSGNCFMPLTWGGRIRSLEDIRARIRRGADKVSLNWAAVHQPNLITQGAKIFGAQAMVVSIDAVRHHDGRTEAFIDGGRTATGLRPGELARRAEEAGAGEILLQSIDRDGTGVGYDLALIEEVVSAISIPVIACGGVGRYEDYAKGIAAGASAVAAANIWHFKELSDRGGKRALVRAGVDVRV
jgi:cyclase